MQNIYLALDLLNEYCVGWLLKDDTQVGGLADMVVSVSNSHSSC